MLCVCILQLLSSDHPLHVRRCKDMLLLWRIFLLFLYRDVTTEGSQVKVWRQKMPLSLYPLPVAYAAVHSKVEGLLLLINCIMYLLLFVGVLFLAFVLVCITLCPY